MKNLIKTNQTLLRVTITLISFTFQLNSNAQSPIVKPEDKSVSIYTELGANVSANGHGIIYNPSISLKKGRSVFSLSPSIQNKTNLLRGGRGTYSFILYGPGNEFFLKRELDEDEYSFVARPKLREERFQINFFVFTQYLDKLPLGIGYQEDEYFTNRIENYDWSKAKLSTIEFGFGFEFRSKISENIFWKNQISAVLVHHNKYISNMTHERSFSTIGIGTAIEFKY